jgi:transcriptional regulator with XRE-family HTH domain
MDDEERRKQLKAFLRARREALSPAALGLEAGPRRRTPGLRREEVAAIARVGVTWYTWLEQGRSIQPSRDALQRIARALRLTPTDERYFFLLAGEAPLPHAPTRDFVVHPYLRTMMDTSRSACLLWGPYLDVLAYNRAADAIYDFDGWEGPFARNLAWRLFMDPKRRALYVDFDEVAVRVVATLRASAAARTGQPELQRLVDGLRTNSKEFNRLWQDEANPTASLDRFEMRLRHPRLGRLRLERLVLLLATEPDLTLVILSGADEKTAQVLSRLSRLKTRVKVPSGSTGR